MFAIGPLYQEQSTFEKHCLIRDIVALLESALALYLHNKGYDVAGKHPSVGKVNKELFSEIQRAVDKVL